MLNIQKCEGPVPDVLESSIFMVIMILIIKIKTIIICNEICLKYVQTVSGVPAPKHLGYFEWSDEVRAKREPSLRNEYIKWPSGVFF